MAVRACQLDPNLRDRPWTEIYYAVRCLCVSNDLSVRCMTHQAQQRPDHVDKVVTNWFTYIRPVIRADDVDDRYVINMDQTPLPFNLAPTTTLARHNSATVGIRRSGNCTAHATCALTVAADGTKLKPFLIFKGTTNGRIFRNEFPTYACRDEVELRTQSGWTQS